MNSGLYALAGTDVLRQRDKAVQMAANTFGAGRCVYVSGLPYSFENNRLLHRALLWCARKEGMLRVWFSENPGTELHAYPDAGKFCVVNNTNSPQETTVWRGDGSSFTCRMQANEICWYPA